MAERAHKNGSQPSDEALAEQRARLMKERREAFAREGREVRRRLREIARKRGIFGITTSTG